MNLEYEEKCYVTFETNKGTAHLLTELAHIEGITQGKLIDRICTLYLMEKVKEIQDKIEKEII